MENKSLKLSPPWITFTNEVKALFGGDPDIKITYDNDSHVLKLFVNNTEKADAISKLLPTQKEFGNVVLKIQVVPANLTAETKDDIFRKAFKGNPVLSDVRVIKGAIFFDGACYVVFKKEVVQFFNDNLQDIYGNENTLYQTIARDVFGDIDGVFYCTDTAE